MNQWDIVLYPFDDEKKPHPILVISNTEICNNKDIEEVNGLFCRSAGVKDPKKHQAILDESDGLDWKTLVDCDFILTLPKDKFKNQRGHIGSDARRKEIAVKIAFCFRLGLYVR